jgi:hypothetical protein
MVLLGEMHFIPSGPDSWFNLPRQSVAYAAQESWVQSGTIRVSFISCLIYVDFVLALTRLVRTISFLGQSLMKIGTTEVCHCLFHKVISHLFISTT